MALVFTNLSAAQTALELVPAVAGRIIVVQRLIVTAWVGLAITLLSDPGGAEESAIAATTRVANASAGVIDFAGSFALPAARGRSVGLSTSFQGSTGPYGIMLWYKVVN